MYEDNSFEVRGRNVHSRMSMEKSYMFRTYDGNDLQDWFTKLVDMSQRFRPMHMFGGGWDEEEDEDEQAGAGGYGQKPRALPPMPVDDEESEEEEEDDGCPTWRAGGGGGGTDSNKFNRKEQQPIRFPSGHHGFTGTGAVGSSSGAKYQQDEDDNEQIHPARIVQVPADQIRMQLSQEEGSSSAQKQTTNRQVHNGDTTEEDDDDEWDTIPQHEHDDMSPTTSSHGGGPTGSQGK